MCRFSSLVMTSWLLLVAASCSKDQPLPPPQPSGGKTAAAGPEAQASTTAAVTAVASGQTPAPTPPPVGGVPQPAAAAPPAAVPAKTGPDYRATPDPFLAVTDKGFELYVGGQQLRLLSPPLKGDNTDWALSPTHLILVHDARVEAIELATGAATVLQEGIFHSVYKQLGHLYVDELADVLELETGDPETYTTSEYDYDFDRARRARIPLPKKTGATLAVPSSPVCVWADQKPQGRASIQVKPRGDDWTVDIAEADGSPRELLTLTGLYSLSEIRAANAERDSGLSEEPNIRCTWMAAPAHMRCVVSNHLDDDGVMEAFWYDETNRKVLLHERLGSEGPGAESPSRCWEQVSGAVVGPVPYSGGTGFASWISPVASGPASGAAAAQPALAATRVPDTEPGNLVPYPPHHLQVRSSSSDKPVKNGGGTLTYDASGAADGGLATAWCEGVEGDGRNEWVEFQLPSPTKVRGVRIFNGYQKELKDRLGDRFPINQRVLDLKVELGSGQAQLVELGDVRDPQFVSLPADTVTSVKLTVLSVYPAKYADTCISEVELMVSPEDAPRWVAPARTMPPERAATIAAYALSVGGDAFAALVAPASPTTWEYCSIDGQPDATWKNPGQCGSTSLASPGDAKEAVDNLETRGIAGIQFASVVGCRSGVCEFSEAPDVSPAVARVRSITLGEGNGTWVVRGVKLVAYR